MNLFLSFIISDPVPSLQYLFIAITIPGLGPFSHSIICKIDDVRNNDYSFNYSFSDIG